MRKYKSYEVVIRNENGEELFDPIEIPYPVPQGMYGGKGYDEYEEKIAILNKVASELLQENERILKGEGFDPPVKNKNVCDGNQYDRLSIPPQGYIRSLESFREKYDVRLIFPEHDVNLNANYKNVVEYLQMTDWFNYILNRVNTFGGINRMVHKYAFINVVSVIEAFIQEAAYNSFMFCRTCDGGNMCPHLADCINYIADAKDKRAPMKKILRRIEINDLLGLNKKTRGSGINHYAELEELFEERNKIHIRRQSNGTSGNNPASNQDDDEEKNIKLYNKAIKYLFITGDACVYNMVPYYNSCRGFEK